MARKAWGDLSPSYRARLLRHGITEKTHGKVVADSARGHGKTPERPERAAKNPDKYRDYMNRRQDLQRQVVAKKERLFGDRRQFHKGRSEKVVRDARPTMAQMRAFLDLDDADVDDLDYESDENDFLFYH